jgi:hypothetical protein
VTPAVLTRIAVNLAVKTVDALAEQLCGDIDLGVRRSSLLSTTRSVVLAGDATVWLRAATEAHS